jgi:membrane glycosyltransferase
MKTWIILGVLIAMASALCNAWQRHMVTTPAYQQALGDKLTLLHREHPDWGREQLADQVASEASKSTMLTGLVVDLIIIVLFAILSWWIGARWWFIGIGFLLMVCGVFWIAFL